MSSGRFAEVRTPLVLSILMVLMTQVGYLDLMNAWSGDEETLDDAEPVVAHSPSTSVMYGNNSMWVSGTNGPVRNAEYIALAPDVILFQGTISKDSMPGCAMAYNASNATVWQPNTGATYSCAGSVKHYVTMIDDITYFTYASTSSNAGNLYAYNPDNDTIYNVSWDFSNRVESAVAIGRTIYLSVPQAWYVGITGTHFAYNIDNQTTWALPSPAGTAWHHQQMMVVGTKIFVHAFTGSGVTNIGPQVFNTENNTWTNVTSMPTKGQFGRPAAGLVSNGQLLFIGSDDASITSPYTSGNGSEYWIYDSSNDTAWPLGDFCAGACHGALRFDADKAQPQIRDGTEMYFIARSYETATANQGHYGLWGYSTTNSTAWHMKNLSSTFSQVAVETSPGLPYPTSTYIKLAMLANGDFVIASRSQTSGGQHEMAFYSPTNGTLWQPTMETSDSLGFDVPSQFARMLGVYGNTVYLAYSTKLVAYNAANQTGVGQSVPGNQPDYLNGAPILTGSTFAMANHCGNGVAISCPNGYRNTFLQWAPESVTVSDAWNLTPGQRIDGPITGGNGIHFDSGVAVQSMTASAAGAELLVGQAMADITFEYIGLTTYGNYSTWEATNINSPAMSMPGANMQTLVGDTIYFDASDQTAGTELWAYDTSNHSEWRVADINSGSGASFPGVLMELLVGDTLYFSADDGTTGRELWAYNTSNSSVPWQVADINSGGGHSDPGKHLSMVIDDVLYFSANDGSTGGELYAYNTSNGSDPWLVDDLFSGGTGSSPGNFMQVLVDDTIYFDARGGNSNGIELWAYNTSDHSTQRVTDINSGTGHSRPGAFFSTLVDDTIYFSATDGTTGVELWAYDTSNHSTWRVADINSGSQDSKPGEHLNLLVGDTIYFSADDGSTDVELWAHDTSNHSTWRVADICSVGSCNLAPAYGRPDGSAPGYNMQVLVGDTFYFDAFTSSTGVELWAHDTSNDSTWNAAEMTSGTGSGISAVTFNMLQIAVGDTLYFSAQDGSNSMELWAHRGAEFTPSPTNVNGASSCSSSPSLPLGLSIDSSTCTISGTPTSPSTNQTYTITAVM
ncbi:MAG: putative Ig domain-containing protein, partial [Candidatus Thermoplasmatota archaeon]|nr:putative Ig domain-containing protein [Candidatus Thermoplasmatota archaeon]